MLEVEPPSERPSLAVQEEICHAVKNNVLQNRRVNMQQIADTVGISTSTVNMILQNTCMMTKVCVRWVPQMFDQKMKVCRRKASNENLKLIQQNWNLFIRRIVTDDETW